MLVADNCCVRSQSVEGGGGFGCYLSINMWGKRITRVSSYASDKETRIIKRLTLALQRVAEERDVPGVVGTVPRDPYSVISLRTEAQIGQTRHPT